MSGSPQHWNATAQTAMINRTPGAVQTSDAGGARTATSNNGFRPLTGRQTNKEEDE